MTSLHSNQDRHQGQATPTGRVATGLVWAWIIGAGLAYLLAFRDVADVVLAAVRRVL